MTEARVGDADADADTDADADADADDDTATAPDVDTAADGAALVDTACTGGVSSSSGIVAARNEDAALSSAG